MNLHSIYVKPLSGPTLLINADLTHSQGVQLIKGRIEERTGIPVAQQRLLFSGRQLLLADEGGRCSLGDYGLMPGSTLHLTLGLQGGIKIRVETLGNNSNTVTLDVKPTDKVRDVKKKVELALGIPVDQQVLAHSGLQLEDDKCVFDYEFMPHTLIHLVVQDRFELSVRIVVETLNSQRIALLVRREQTVRELKCAIRDAANIPVEKQMLLFVKKELQDTSTLKDCGVDTDSVIHLGMQIFISTPAPQRLITLLVHPSTLVENVRSQIHERENIEPEEQRLIFGAKQLEDGHQLSEYNIQPGSTIHLVFRLTGGR